MKRRDRDHLKNCRMSQFCTWSRIRGRCTVPEDLHLCKKMSRWLANSLFLQYLTSTVSNFF